MTICTYVSVILYIFKAWRFKKNVLFNKEELVKLLCVPRGRAILSGAQRLCNCSGSTPLNCTSAFTACISIHNTALWTQKVMPIEKQSFSQQRAGTVALIETGTTWICAWLLCYETSDNWLSNAIWQYVANSSADYYCRVVSQGWAYVFVYTYSEQAELQ